MRRLVIWFWFCATCALAIPLKHTYSVSATLDDAYGLAILARDIGGLFGGGMEYPDPVLTMKEPLTLSRPTANSLDQGILGSLQSTGGKSTKLKDATITYTSSTEAANPTSHSIIGTPGDLPSTSPATDIAFTRVMPTTTAAAASPSPSTSSSPPGLAGVSTEWKVMGIAVIAISGLAVMVVTVVFYDQWSKFLVDIVCCGKRKKDEGFEEFVPDWEKRSWELQLKEEDAGSQRYPSVEDIAHPPAAVTRKPTIRPIDPAPANILPSYPNPFESYLDYQQPPYTSETHDTTDPSYTYTQPTKNDRRQHGHDHVNTLNPYDGIA